MSKLARPKRFELLTPRFVVWCYIQLSHGRFAGHTGRFRLFAATLSLPRHLPIVGIGLVRSGSHANW